MPCGAYQGTGTLHYCGCISFGSNICVVTRFTCTSVISNSLYSLAATVFTFAFHQVCFPFVFAAMSPHHPLSVSSHEIRVLSIISNVDYKHQPLQLSLKVVSLIDYTPDYVSFLSKWPATTTKSMLMAKWNEQYARDDYAFRYNWGEFMALSYMWGDPNDTTDVEVDGHLISITTSLESYLRSSHDHDQDELGVKSVYLWADALCINQADLAEKEIQVSQMHRIYKAAPVVRVYLRGSPEFADPCFKFIQRASKAWCGSKADLQAFYTRLQFDSNDDTDWRAFFLFVANPYWKRLWVLQELALGGLTCQLRWGQSNILWNQVCDCFDALTDIFTLVVIKIRMRAPPEFDGKDSHLRYTMYLRNFRSLDGLGSKIPTVRETMLFARRAQCYDSRDRVYGMMALFPKDLASRINVSYTITTQEATQNFVRALISSSGELDIVYSDHAKDLSDQSLVSWVPDFSCDLRLIGSSADISRSASRNSRHELPMPSDDNTLVCEGIFIDETDGVSCTCVNYGDIKVKNPSGPIPNHKYEITPPTSHLNIQPRSTSCRYIGETAITNALWSALLEESDTNPTVLTKLQTLPSLHGKGLEALLNERLDIFKANLGMVDMFLTCSGSLSIFGKPLSSYFSPQPQPAIVSGEFDIEFNLAFERLCATAGSRKLFTTVSGYVGAGPLRMRSGDRVCVLKGASSPVLLRETTGEGWRVVGDCYIPDLMQGEAMDMLDAGEMKLETIRLV